MTPKDAAAMRAREIKEQQEIAESTVHMTRYGLTQALNMAADVMQNSAAVAKSDAWKGHYHGFAKAYRDTANAIAAGAKFAIKG